MTRRVTAPPLVPSADLALTVADTPDPVTVGAELTYTLSVTNAGPDVAARVAVGTNQLAPLLANGSVQFVRSAGQCVVQNGVLACLIENLAPGPAATVALVVRPMAAMVLSVQWIATPFDVSETKDPNAGNDLAATSTTVLAAAPPPPPPPRGNCHASYPDVCIPPPPPDLDCGQVSYRNFRVIYTVPDPDPHRFDGDRDGVGCES